MDEWSHTQKSHPYNDPQSSSWEMIYRIKRGAKTEIAFLKTYHCSFLLLVAVVCKDVKYAKVPFCDIIGRVLPLQEVALHQNPLSFSALPLQEVALHQNPPSFSALPLQEVALHQNPPSFSALPLQEVALHQNPPSFSALPLQEVVFHQNPPSFSALPLQEVAFRQNPPTFSALPLQEVALRQNPPTFSALCYPCPYRSLLPHTVISLTIVLVFQLILRPLSARLCF